MYDQSAPNGFQGAHANDIDGAQFVAETGGEEDQEMCERCNRRFVEG